MTSRIHYETLLAEFRWLREQASECYGTAQRADMDRDQSDWWRFWGDQWADAADRVWGAAEALRTLTD
jgi:hypothetical protein